ncbi:MAG: cupin domain-containing protein [Thermoanaerobaculia bacterium]
MRKIGLPAMSLLCLTLLPAAIHGAAAEAPAVEITAEPSHHLALENENVRVFKVEVAPHAATLMHLHGHDYLFVAIGDAHFMNEVQGKAPAEVKLADGEVRFASAPLTHAVKNLADTPFRNVTVELVQDAKLRQAPSPWPPESEGNRELPGVHLKVLFIHDGARVSEVVIQPGATVPSHHHDGPHLVVAVSDLELRSDVEGRGPVNTSIKAGDVHWIPGGFTHTLTNTGKSPARLVTVEFKPDAAHS